jgi:ADP-ribosylglycohydrolase
MAVVCLERTGRGALMSALPQDRLVRAQCSLEGLSVGDAFGQRFFRHRAFIARAWLQGDSGAPSLRDLDDPLGPPPWRWTDDTAMALGIVATLRDHAEINEDHLARAFALQYAADPRRGYGPAMHTLLPQLRHPTAWQTAPRRLFGGQGSFGNGAAMRVAPLGAYFADDLDATVEHARRSALVTHAHPEAVAGAIAVAGAAAWAWRLRGTVPPPPQDFLDRVLRLVPDSEVARAVRRARDLDSGTPVHTAAATLGNGSQVSAQDTVPFVLWSSARHLANFEEALWHTVSGFGDMDTTCAMVGGIVATYTGIDRIPAGWRCNREPLPA